MNIKARKVTYIDIAREAGVSVATVSRVMNQKGVVKEETIRQVQNAILKLNQNFPSCSEDLNPKMDNVLQSEPHTILCFLPNIGNPFYTDVLRGIKRAADLHNYSIFLYSDSIKESNIDRIINLIQPHRFSGALILTELAEKTLKQLKELFPIVQCSDYTEGTRHSFVTIDNYKSAREAMKYIISAGRRNIALVSNSPENYFFSKLRIKAYEDSLREAHLSVAPYKKLLFPSREFDFSTVSDAVTAILQLDSQIDGIFCTSDMFAAAAIHACAEMGLKVPRDVAVIGFDNLDISLLTSPAITTISQPRFNIGFTACKFLIDAITDPSLPPQQTYLKTELIVRGSA